MPRRDREDLRDLLVVLLAAGLGGLAVFGGLFLLLDWAEGARLLAVQVLATVCVHLAAYGGAIGLGAALYRRARRRESAEMEDLPQVMVPGTQAYLLPAALILLCAAIGSIVVFGYRVDLGDYLDPARPDGPMAGLLLCLLAGPVGALCLWRLAWIRVAWSERGLRVSRFLRRRRALAWRDVERIELKGDRRGSVAAVALYAGGRRLRISGALFDGDRDWAPFVRDIRAAARTYHIAVRQGG